MRWRQFRGCRSFLHHLFLFAASSFTRPQFGGSFGRRRGATFLQFVLLTFSLSFTTATPITPIVPITSTTAIVGTVVGIAMNAAVDAAVDAAAASSMVCFAQFCFFAFGFLNFVQIQHPILHVWVQLQCFFKISNGTVVFLSICVGRPSGHIRVGVQGIDRNGLVVPRQCLLKS